MAFEETSARGGSITKLRRKDRKEIKLGIHPLKEDGELDSSFCQFCLTGISEAETG